MATARRAGPMLATKVVRTRLDVTKLSLVNTCGLALAWRCRARNVPKLGPQARSIIIRTLLRSNEGEKGRCRLTCSTLRFLRRGRCSATGSLRTHHRVSGSLRSSAVKTRPLSLRCFPKVISENPAKTFPTLNAHLNAATVGHFADQPVVETLVISFQMVMSDVSANGRAKMILSERNDPVETLVFYRTNKTLRVSVQIRTPCG